MAKQTLAAELTALSDACALKPDGSTIPELCTATGWGQDKVRKWLRVLNTQGRLEVAKRTTTNIAGSMSMTPVYMVKRGK